MLLEQVVVGADAAGPVAHRVHVLAEHQRLGAHPDRLGGRVQVADEAGVGADRGRLGVVRVHPRVEVGVGGAVVALVVHGAAGVAPVHPLGHGRQVAARPGLVAEGPHDDARVVQVALDGALDAVEVGLGPRRVVARVARPVVEDEAVGLEVALEHDPEAELVGEVEQAGVRRVVAGADGVDVRALHGDEVLAGELLVEHPPTDRVGLVAVHAAEDQPVAVHQEAVAHDAHVTEPQPQAHRLPGRAHGGRVEAGRLGGPRLDPADVEGAELGRAREGALHAELGHADGDRVGVLAGDQARVQRAAPRRPARGGVRGVQPDLVQRTPGTGEQGDRAEDAGQPPLVLVLDVARGRPLVDADGQHVRARPQRVGDVELLHQAAALADADLHAVQPDAVERLDAVEADQRPGPPTVVDPAGRLERAPVVAGRVVVGHVRRVEREGVLHVGVRRGAVAALARGVAVQDPVRRDRQGVPGPVVVRRVGEARIEADGGGRPPEPPVAVEAERRGVGLDPGPRAAPPAAARAGVLEVGQVVGQRGLVHDFDVIARAR